MKISAFVLGGIAGAAAAMLLRKQSVGAMVGGLSQMLSSKGGPKKESRSKALSLLFGSGSASDGHSAGASASPSSDTASSSQKSGIEEIAQIASQDEGVKKEINAILEQNE